MSSMFFDGRLVSESSRTEFFASNRFYTTPTARMTRDLTAFSVTPGEAIASLSGGKGVPRA